MCSMKQKMVGTINENVMPSYIYTYPTKKSYQPYTDWRKACESWLQVKGPITLYIHIPFCEMKCSFCDLFTATNQPQDVFERYVRALIREIEIMKNFLQTDRITVKSVYFGGGTPALLNEKQLSLIISKLRQTFSFIDNPEWSIEGAPNSLSPDKIAELKKCGFNRLSMGIQTFDKDELRAVGRFYDVSLGYEMAKIAVASGIKNINLDLIYGIPGQDFDKWRRNLQKAIEIGPATITNYPIVLRDRTAFGKQKERQVRSDFVEAKTRYEWFDFTREELIKNGYQQHTLVTFAKQEGGCQHEANEFSGAPTLSLGAGSRKYAPDIHYVDEDYVHRKPNKVTMMEYMDAIERGEILVKSAVTLCKTDQVLRYVILGLLSVGIESKMFYQRFQESMDDRFAELLEALQELGMIHRTGSVIKLTGKGIRFSSHIGHFIAENYGGRHALV